MELHKNARSCPASRLLLVRRVEAGMSLTSAAEAAGLSRQRASQWRRRYREAGEAALVDRSSRPHRMPSKAHPDRVEEVLRLRRRRDTAAQIAPRVGLSIATVNRILARHGISRLKNLDPKEPIVRYQREHPGELIHVDIKKLGRIPKGGGWRAHGRGKTKRAKVGYAFVHSAVDGYTRIAYSEVLANEQGVTAAGFWLRAAVFYATLGIVIERVITDNGPCYKSSKFNDALGEKIKHTFIRAYRPQTNGKVERFNRTLLAEWAYARTWTSEGQRTRALARWIHIYNHHRHHTAIGGAPIGRVSNLPGHYT